MKISEETTKKILPWLVAVALFMEMVDTTILNTAVPTIATSIGVAPLAMKSVLSSYSLSLAVFIPVSGWVADRFGTRRVFATAIAIFTLGSMLCGLMNEIHLLVLCRVIQGCGGAMMVPVGRLTLVRSFAKSELVRAMTFVSIPALVGPMLGPLVGGLLVGIHWRLIFFVNIPIGLLGLLCVQLFLPDHRAERVPPLDFNGLVLFGSGIALLSYVLEVFGEHTLGYLEIVGLLGIAIILICAYGRHAMEAPHPLLRLSLLEIRTFRIAVIGAFITRLGAGGMPFLLPLLYQVGLGFSPVESGLLLVPQSAAAILLKFSIPHILARLGYRAVLLSNTVMMGSMMMAFSEVGAATPIGVTIAIAAAFGFCSSLQYTSMNTLTFADVDQEDVSMASTIASTMQQMSMSFGIATASLATAIFIPRATADASTMISGIHRAFIALGAVTVLSALVFTSVRRDDGNVVAHHDVHA
jgi:EmrB/QacA subfamily drug resistance transporter